MFSSLLVYLRLVAIMVHGKSMCESNHAHAVVGAVAAGEVALFWGVQPDL